MADTQEFADGMDRPLETLKFYGTAFELERALKWNAIGIKTGQKL